MKNILSLVLTTVVLVSPSFSQASTNAASTDKAAAVIARAVEAMGGQRYLSVNTQVSRGKFTLFRQGQIASFQSFTDVIVFPAKERTDFRGEGRRMIQVNTGDTGWVYDGDQDIVRVQTEKQIAGFKEGVRTSLDNFLRGGWKSDGKIEYVGRRASTLGRRNDVIRLTYNDGLVVEFEIAEDGTPQKALFTRRSGDEESKEEDRYAQFIDVGGIKAPFVIDRYTNGRHASRINYEWIEFNKRVPESIFAKPATPKDAKKEIKISE
jgi:hypothetical protein